MKAPHSRSRGSSASGEAPAPKLRGEGKTTASRSPRLRRTRPLDAGSFAADIASFELHLAAENKAAGTIRIYTEAPRWFAAAHLRCDTDKTSWEQVDTQDVQRWVVWLLRHYSETYAYQQYRSLQQFFRWLAVEDEIADPMARLRAPKVIVTAVPVFTSVELSELNKACHGRSFAARRDAAIIAVFTATGIRLSELAGIRYHPGDPARSDPDLHGREIRIRGKGGTARTVKIGHQAARSLDRYLRARGPARASAPASAVARREQPGAADRDRDLPDRRPPRPAMRGERVPAPVSGTTSATPVSTEEAPRAT